MKHKLTQKKDGKMKSVKMLVPYLFAVLLLFAVNAAASVFLNFDMPVSGTVLNPCNGETVTFSGIDHFTFIIDGTGLILRDNIHVTAIGSLGNSYEGNTEDINQFGDRVGAEGTTVSTIRLISTGSAPNFEMDQVVHVTVNPNGTVTADAGHFTSNCRG